MELLRIIRSSCSEPRPPRMGAAIAGAPSSFLVCGCGCVSGRREVSSGCAGL